MGERIALCVQAKSTASGRSSPLGPRAIALDLDVQRADQREEAPRGVVVDGDLAVETLSQELRTFVMQAAAAHVDRLDLRGRGVADRLIITLANNEVVLDHPLQWRERKDVRRLRGAFFGRDLEHQPIFLNAEAEAVVAAVGAGGGEAV